MPSPSTLAALRAFVEERDWDQFHTPENLAKNIVIESGELLECFQWNGQFDQTRVEEELADVVTYCIHLAIRIGADLDDIVLRKLESSRTKYPVEQARGRMVKYTQLAAEGRPTGDGKTDHDAPQRSRSTREDDAMTPQRTVLLHASAQPGDVARAIGMAGILHTERPETRIRIIVNGPAIPGVAAASAPLPMTDDSAIEACEGGLRSHRIGVDELQPGVITVPAAVVALSDAQFDGAAYIRV